MLKADFIEEYKAYCIGRGRPTSDTDNTELMADEVDLALETCDFFTSWNPLVYFDEYLDEPKTIYIRGVGNYILPGTGIIRLNELRIDDILVSNSYYKLINVSTDGAFFCVSVNTNHILITPEQTIKLTGVFGKIKNLTKYEKKQIFALAFGLAGKDAIFDIYMNQQITELKAGSETIKFNRNMLSADNVFTILSYFGDCKSILLKHRRFKVA